MRLLREMRLVGHDNHRLAVLLRQPLEDIEHLLRVLAVEIARGSSARIMAGLFASARATATRWR